MIIVDLILLFISGKLASSLYKSGDAGNYVDMSVDENGLWALFGLAAENNTVREQGTVTQREGGYKEKVENGQFRILKRHL